eukprot:TRINITY_DN651_c0_g1_i4.p1 TRINITY_DN651_c0_g1~~TRINITY_DN651_c0_g1_i4.p1  ORF type:complete len:381 (-),score=107.73 TRINITY_DN651_c0_g1_i4:880-2022(-)
MNSTNATVTGTSPRPSSRRLLMLCSLALVAGIGAAKWLDARGSTSYGGSLQSRITCVMSERPARVHEVFLVPGQRVVPGDKLLRLADDQLTAQIIEKQRELVELEADLKMVQAKAEVELEWRRRELSTEIFQTQLKVSTVTQERTAKQVEQLAWQDQLQNLKGDRTGPDLADAVLPVRSVVIDAPFVDERRLQAMLKEDAAAVAAEALSEQLALCEQQLEKLRKLDQQLPEKVRVSVGVDLVETRIGRARDELAGFEKQRDSLTVVSSSHGIVGTIHHGIGDQVGAGDPLVELLDDERRHLVACIPSRAATKLRPGTRVDLIFPGREPRIGLVAAIPPHAIPADQSRPTDDSQVEVKVEPAGKLWPKLPVGSRVQVQVLQ